MKKIEKEFADFIVLRKSYSFLKKVVLGEALVIFALLLLNYAQANRPVNPPKPVVIQVDRDGNAIPLYNYEIFSRPQMAEVLKFSAFVTKQFLEIDPLAEKVEKHLARIAPFLSSQLFASYSKQSRAFAARVAADSLRVLVRVRKLSVENNAFPYVIKSEALRLYYRSDIESAELVYMTATVSFTKRTYQNPWGLVLSEINKLETVRLSPEDIKKILSSTQEEEQR